MCTIIVFCSSHAGRERANADALSRLPLEETIENVPLLGDTVQMLETLNTGNSIVATAAIKAGMQFSLVSAQ